MFNSLELFALEGRRSGAARRNRDASGAEWGLAWLERALLCEAKEDRNAARAAFEAGYREEAAVPDYMRDAPR